MSYKQDRIEESERKVRQLIEANPLLCGLIEELDLVNPLTGFPYFEKEPEPITQTQREKLKRIAERLLIRGRIYTSEQVVSAIMGFHKIERKRAVNGLKMMLSSGVLTLNTGDGVRLS